MRGNEVREARIGEHGNELAVGELEQRVEVLAKRALPELGVLRDDGHRLAQVVQAEGRDVDAVNVHSALGSFEYAEECEGKRRLAGARAADHADALVRARRERDVLEHRLEALAVARRVVAELDDATLRPLGRQRRRAEVRRLGRQLAVLEHALNADNVLLDLARGAHGPVERLRCAEHLREHQTKQACAHAAVGCDQVHGHSAREKEDAAAEHLDAHGKPAVARNRREVAHLVAIDAHLKHLGKARILGKCADRRETAKRLLEPREHGRLGHGVEPLELARRREIVEHDAAVRHAKRDDDEQKGRHRVRHNAQHTDDDHERARHTLDHAREDLVNHAHVAAEQIEQAARRRALKPLQWVVQQAKKQPIVKVPSAAQYQPHVQDHRRNTHADTRSQASQRIQREIARRCARHVAEPRVRCAPLFQHNVARDAERLRDSVRHKVQHNTAGARTVNVPLVHVPLDAARLLQLTRRTRLGELLLRHGTNLCTRQHARARKRRGGSSSVSTSRRLGRRARLVAPAEPADQPIDVAAHRHHLIKGALLRQQAAAAHRQDAVARVQIRHRIRRQHARLVAQQALWTKHVLPQVRADVRVNRRERVVQ